MVYYLYFLEDSLNPIDLLRIFRLILLHWNLLSGGAERVPSKSSREALIKHYDHPAMSLQDCQLRILHVIIYVKSLAMLQSAIKFCCQASIMQSQRPNRVERVKKGRGCQTAPGSSSFTLTCSSPTAQCPICKQFPAFTKPNLSMTFGS